MDWHERCEMDYSKLAHYFLVAYPTRVAIDLDPVVVEPDDLVVDPVGAHSRLGIPFLLVKWGLDLLAETERYVDVEAFDDDGLCGD